MIEKLGYRLYEVNLVAKRDAAIWHKVLIFKSIQYEVDDCLTISI